MIPNTRLMKIPAALLLLYLFSCEHPTEPKPDPGPDTTSHHFIWRVDTLGGIFSTAISIEIVSETEAYVGGEFFVYPNPNDLSISERYNLAVWNGVKWTFEKVNFQINDQSKDFQQSPIKQIRKIGESSLLFLSIGAECVFRKNGKDSYKNAKSPVNYCWARSETDIYFTGYGGAFTHYDGVSFRSIPTGVTNDFVDIWGDEESVWITSDDKSSTAFAFGEYRNNNFRMVDNNPKGESRFPFGYISVYKPSIKSPLYLLIQGFTLEVNSTAPLTYSTILNHVESGYYFYWVRGNAPNDLYLGDWNTQSFAHFNGKTWKTFTVNGEGQEAFTVRGNLIGGCGNNSNLIPPRVYMAKRF
ncbi:MAG: hypothetical protein HUU10_08365 [Bacteroidetes bacterium]|nr:hypothetical protein [Bacteroidota bacterium]